MEFSGPNGQVKITLTTSRDGSTKLILGSLAELDTSKTERLKIDGVHLRSKAPLYQALLPMKDLRTFTLSKYKSPGTLIHALRPPKNSSEVMVCPKLEEFVLVICPFPFGRDQSDITSIAEMAAARASRGGKVKTVRMFHRRGTPDPDVSELRKHAWNVEYARMNWL